MLLYSLPLLIFWGSIGLLFYTFLGYGILISALARGRSKRTSPPAEGAPQPSVCIVLVTLNEEKNIEPRLRNLLDSQYPPEKLRILLISDGSTDATVTRAQSLQDPRIEIVERPQRSGKAAGLNLALSRCQTEIVIFTDARQTFAPDAIARLAAHFTDPAIGAVSGSLEIAPAASGTGSGIDAYWRYEKWLRAAESRFDSCVGCTGAIYALRPGLFSPIPEDTLLDDVVIPMQAAARGARVIHDPEALAFDPQSLEPEAEQRRKQRTLAGGFQMLFRYPGWMLPWRHRLWWQLISHKYLRLVAPFLLVTAFLSNIPLANQPFYALCLVAQVCFFLAAAVSNLPAMRHWKLARLPAGFVFLNLQVLRGLRYYLAGAGRQGWQ
jgi:cellulose synthase/poly-beta-1,6-N-acetylglucosamine synthase-like glycosyltransferase